MHFKNDIEKLEYDLKIKKTTAETKIELQTSMEKCKV